MLRTLGTLATLFMLSCAAFAQDAPVINHLAALPVLHENGKSWHVQVRFTTSIPALCHVEVGPSADALTRAEPEDERLRNHRFDIPGEGDRSRFLRVVADAGGARISSDVMQIEPPEPFPEGNVERVEIPLTVEETAGVARKEPVTFGLPLPEGALGDPAHVALADGGEPITLQARATVRWPDGTIKWLLLSGVISLNANETKTLELALGTAVEPTEPSREAVVIESDQSVSCSGGALRLHIDRNTGEGSIEALDGSLTPLPISRLIADDGTVYTGKIEDIEVEEAGPLRVTIVTRGHHVNKAGEPYFGFELRYFLHADDPFVRIDHILQHDIVTADMTYGDEMKSFRSLDLVFPTGANSADVPLEDGTVARLATGQRLFQHEHNAYVLPKAAGERGPGLAKAGDVTVAVRDFWQHWPKALALNEDGFAVGLYPEITPRDRYANRPDEHILYYYVRDGKYTFRSGFEKRHQLLVGPADGAAAEQILARVNAPLLVTAPPEWYIGSGALHGIGAVDGREFEAYNDILSDAVDAQLEIRERQGWYGLMNVGDWWGERGNNWGNVEYDMQHAMLTQYFRTGDRRFFELAEDAARHNADVDVVHFAAGQKAGPGRERRVGQAWVHSMGHTGGYYPYDYMDMSIYAQGYAENEGHMWSQGNFEYWLLTGDRQVRRSALQLTDWLAGPNTTDFGYGNARVPGWMGIIAMSGYFATHDPYYLNAMHLIYEEVQEMADPDAGLWVHKLGGGHCRCDEPHYGEAGFMAGVLMTSLKYYYLATDDEEVAERIVKIANWLVKNLYDPKADNFRYTSCPGTGIASSSPMIMGNGLAFAANYSGDAELMALVRRVFMRGFLAFESGGRGKTIAYGTCAAPMAIHEISRFPGPTLDDLYSEMVEVAHDPARQRLPTMVPNPDFEQDLSGWTVRLGLDLSRSTDVAHTGEASAMCEGTIEDQNEYFVTRYSCGPPWEIMSLRPGEDYRLQLWLRVDEFTGDAPAPNARVSVRSKGVTQESFSTGEYDLSKLGEWQRLETQFTVPEGTDAAYIAVNTQSHDARTVRMYLDDVAIVPADTPRQETFVWAIAQATEASLKGGVKLVPEGIIDGWEVLTNLDGEAGAALFALHLPSDGEYALLLRAKSTADLASLSSRVDGEAQPDVTVPNDGWQWLTVADGLSLQAGERTVEIAFPEDAPAILHSVLLTNE